MTDSIDFSNVWSFTKEVSDKNKEVKNAQYGVIDGDKISTDIEGFIINSIGNVVAKFGFFIDAESEHKIDLIVSVDGFLGSIYSKPMNVLLGYSSETGIPGMVNPEKTQILHLGPKSTNGNQLIISIDKNDYLKEYGMICIIRECDVSIDSLSEEIKDDFKISCEEAKIPDSDMSEIEDAYCKYLSHLYLLLGENQEAIDNNDEFEE